MLKLELCYYSWELCGLDLLFPLQLFHFFYSVVVSFNVSLGFVSFIVLMGTFFFLCI